MTEELKQKAEEYARKYINHKMAVHDIFESEVVQKDVTKLLVDFATEVTKQLKEENEHLVEVHESDRRSLTLIIKQGLELKKRNGELAGQKASLERWFGEAKEIIKRLLDCLLDFDEDTISFYKQVIDKAEAFLKECEE